MKSEIEKYQLVLSEICLAQIYDSKFLESILVDVKQNTFMRDDMFRSIQHAISAYFLKQELAELTVRYPKTWWDAVKDRFLPAWLKKRVRINYVCTTLTADAVAKGIKISPDHRGPVLLCRNDVEFSMPEAEPE